MICGSSVTGGAAGHRSQFAVLTVCDLRRLRYRRALTAHPIDVVLYSGIIKRILQTVKFAVSFFAAVSRLKLAVLIVSDMHNLRYRRVLCRTPYLRQCRFIFYMKH